MNIEQIGFEHLVESLGEIHVDRLNTDVEDPALNLYEMGHGEPATWIQIMRSGAVFRRTHTYESGTVDTEVHQRLSYHEDTLNLTSDTIQNNDNITTAVDQRMAKILPGRTMWTQTDGNLVTYTLKDREKHLPSIIHVFEYVPFNTEAQTVADIENELSTILDTDVTF